MNKIVVLIFVVVVLASYKIAIDKEIQYSDAIQKHNTENFIENYRK